MIETGIFGGTFDPIHTGHAIIAGYLAEGYGLDELWLMPGRRNPLKRTAGPVASDADRLAMAQLVADGCRNVGVCDMEMHMPMPSYSYDTLVALREKYLDRRFRMVIGSDNWQVIDRWRNVDRIIAEFGLLIYLRPGYEVADALPDNVSIAEGTPLLDISSTMIRQRLKEDKGINYMVPESVLSYIREKGLYR